MPTSFHAAGASPLHDESMTHIHGGGDSAHDDTHLWGEGCTMTHIHWGGGVSLQCTMSQRHVFMGGEPGRVHVKTALHRHRGVWRCMVQYSAAQYGVVLTVQYSIAQYGVAFMVQYSAVRCGSRATHVSG